MVWPHTHGLEQLRPSLLKATRLPKWTGTSALCCAWLGSPSHRGVSLEGCRGAEQSIVFNSETAGLPAVGSVEWGTVEGASRGKEWRDSDCLEGHTAGEAKPAEPVRVLPPVGNPRELQHVWIQMSISGTAGNVHTDTCIRCLRWTPVTEPWWGVFPSHCSILEETFSSFRHSGKGIVPQDIQESKHCSVPRSTGARSVRVDVASTSASPLISHTMTIRVGGLRAKDPAESAVRGWKLKYSNKLYIVRQAQLVTRTTSLRYSSETQSGRTSGFVHRLPWGQDMSGFHANDKIISTTKEIGHPLQSCLFLSLSPSSREFIYPYWRRSRGIILSCIKAAQQLPRSGAVDVNPTVCRAPHWKTSVKTPPESQRTAVPCTSNCMGGWGMQRAWSHIAWNPLCLRGVFACGLLWVEAGDVSLGCQLELLSTFNASHALLYYTSNPLCLQRRKSCQRPLIQTEFNLSNSIYSGRAAKSIY